MTNDEIRIAIAEACGWKWYRLPPFNRDRQYRGLFHPEIHEYPEQSPEWLVKADGTERVCSMDYMARDGHVPNYPEDLNACHEMEKLLTFSQAANYEITLATISQPSDGSCPPPSYGYTAAQRCEAFLRTIGKWKEQP